MLTPVQFSVWHPLDDAGAHAPIASGIVQTRAEGLLTYPAGRSAMVFYEATRTGETLRAFVAGRGGPRLAHAAKLGARWVRFGAAADPVAELARLLTSFATRFGTVPVGNASSDGAN